MSQRDGKDHARPQGSAEPRHSVQVTLWQPGHVASSLHHASDTLRREQFFEEMLMTAQVPRTRALWVLFCKVLDGH